MKDYLKKNQFRRKLMFEIWQWNNEITEWSSYKLQ